MILAACEVRGTLAAYQLNSNVKVTENPTTQPTEIHKTHINKIRNAKAATYFAKGYTGDTYCTVCGTLIHKGKVIAKKQLKKPTIKVKAKKHKLVVIISKVKSAKFFQVKIKSGKKWKSVKTTKLKTTIKNLIKNKKYQIKVRAVITKGKRKAYSKYSTVESVKIK